MSQCLNRCNENKTKNKLWAAQPEPVHVATTTRAARSCFCSSDQGTSPQSVSISMDQWISGISYDFGLLHLENSRTERGQIRSNDQFISIHFRGLSIADASLAQSTARPPNVWLPHATLLCKGLDLKIRVMAKDYKCSDALSLSRIFKDCSCFKQGCVARLQLGCFIIATHSRSWESSSHWK